MFNLSRVCICFKAYNAKKHYETKHGDYLQLQREVKQS